MYINLKGTDNVKVEFTVSHQDFLLFLHLHIHSLFK